MWKSHVPRPPGLPVVPAAPGSARRSRRGGTRARARPPPATEAPGGLTEGHGPQAGPGGTWRGQFCVSQPAEVAGPGVCVLLPPLCFRRPPALPRGEPGRTEGPPVAVPTGVSVPGLLLAGTGLGDLVMAAEDLSPRCELPPCSAAPSLRPSITRWGARQVAPLLPSPQGCCDKLVPELKAGGGRASALGAGGFWRRPGGRGPWALVM